MGNTLEKIGYSLLALGVIMILGGVAQILLVFTGNLDPISLFSFKSSDFAIDASVLMPQLPSNLTDGLKMEILPAGLINTVLNLSMNTIFMSLIIFAGGKISTIGTNLLRPVYVKMPVKMSQ